MTEPRILCYNGDNCSGSDTESSKEVVARNGRGKNVTWIVTGSFNSFEAATSEYENKLKGRVNRGKCVTTHYFTCKFFSCGCTKQYKVSNVLSTKFPNYVAYESEGSHVFHDNDKRNGGRGLDYRQAEIVMTSLRLGIKTPKAILQFFRESEEDQGTC